MSGTRESLIGLTGSVASGRSGDDVQGALAIYCGGCALHIGDDLDAVGEVETGGGFIFSPSSLNMPLSLSPPSPAYPEPLTPD